MQSLILVAWVAVATSPTKAECRPVEDRACAITLHGRGAPSVSKSCLAEAWGEHLAFRLPERFADANQDNWHETVLQLDLPAEHGCSCAVLRLHHAGLDGYSADVGNSPTSDGNGGDLWTTRHDAELDILRGRLRVFSAEAPKGSPVDFERLLELTLHDGEGMIEIEICDQALDLVVAPAGVPTPWRSSLRAEATQGLFALGRPTEPDGVPSHHVFAAFNRVIHALGDRPTQDRFGSGIVKVELFLTP
ncbi:MAG: hypothetical protein GY716_20910 [bacterium]|nr:hypothetical protein [bacterium]